MLSRFKRETRSVTRPDALRPQADVLDRPTLNRPAFNRTALNRAAGAVVENLEGRTLFATSFDLGVNINEGSSAFMRNAIPKLKSLGVKSVRIWIGTDFKSKSWEGPMQRAVDYANAGFDVMAAVVPNNGTVPSYGDVQSWFNWAMGTGLKGAVDRWQIGNEPDHDKYWRGSNSDYVNKLLKPAAEVLRPKGEDVVSAGPSWSAEDVQDFIDAGMLNYVDYVGFHPYATQNLLATRIKEIKAVVAGRKPIIATEWNVRGLEGDKAKWADAVEKAYPIIKANFAQNYYFGAWNNTGTRAGPGGLLNSNGSTTQFYSALASAKGISGTVIDGGSSSGGSSSGGSTSGGSTSGGSSSSSTSTPNISAIQIVDGSSGKVLVDNITGSRSVDLGSLGTTNIRFQAAVNSATGSVKINAFGKTITENLAPFNTGATGVSSGSYSVSMTAYQKDNLAGTQGNTISATITFTGGSSSGGSTSGGTSSGGSSSGTTSSPAISSMAIVDGSTGKVLVDNITGSRTVDLSTLGTSNIRFQANVNGATDSVKISAFGKTITENLAAFNTSSTGVSTGSYAYSMTPYSKDNLSGTQGSTLSGTITFVKSGSSSSGSTSSGSSSSGSTASSNGSPSITGYNIVDADTGNVIIGNITSSRTIKLSDVGSGDVRFQAITNSDTESTRIVAFGKTVIDNDAPYVSSANRVWKGTYNVQGRAFAGNDATGSQDYKFVQIDFV